MGTSVGTLLAGVIVGWMRSVRPWFGVIPDAAILFMRSIGLAAFVAMIGLKAGPIFVHAVREFGYILFLGGIVVTLTPLIAGLFFGRYVLKLNPALLARRHRRRTDDDRGRRRGSGEVRQPSCHTGLFVHSGIRSHLSDDMGDHYRLPYDLARFDDKTIPRRGGFFDETNRMTDRG